MGMLEDHKIEAAVHEALSASADARALALVQVAVDPAGTKARIEELTAATRAHDAARQAAETAAAGAEIKQKQSAAALAELQTREAAFASWKASTEARLKQREAEVCAGEEARSNQEADLRARENQLRIERATYQALVRDMKSHLANA